jgi:hypothetical protein
MRWVIPAVLGRVNRRIVPLTRYPLGPVGLSIPRS